MLVTGFFIFIFYKIFAFFAFLIFAILLFAGGITLAFIRINGQPFHFFLINILQTWRSPNLQIWDKTLTDAEITERIKQAPLRIKILPPRKEAPVTSRLAEIALIVDTGGVYTPES